MGRVRVYLRRFQRSEPTVISLLQTTTDNDRLAQSDEGDAADGSRLNQLDSLAQYRALQVYVH